MSGHTEAIHHLNSVIVLYVLWLDQSRYKTSFLLCLQSALHYITTFDIFCYVRGIILFFSGYSYKIRRKNLLKFERPSVTNRVQVFSPSYSLCQWSKNYPKIYKPPKNVRGQKSDKNQFHNGPTNIMRNRRKFATATWRPKFVHPCFM